MHTSITPPVTAKGCDGFHHLRYAECTAYLCIKCMAQEKIMVKHIVLVLDLFRVNPFSNNPWFLRV